MLFCFVLFCFFPVTTWMSCQVILVGHALLGKFTAVPSFRHLWIMALTVLVSPKALEICILFQTGRCLWLCFAAVSLDCSVMCCFWRSLASFTLTNRFCLSDFLTQVWVWLVKVIGTFQEMWLFPVGSWLTRGAVTFSVLRSVYKIV